jgi:hypothetical protein
MRRNGVPFRSRHSHGKQNASDITIRSYTRFDRKCETGSDASEIIGKHYG